MAIGDLFDVVGGGLSVLVSVSSCPADFGNLLE